MPMNPEIKAKWVAALRSGEYKQARKTLFRPETGGYCCLGVLCDVIKPKEWDGKAFNYTEDGETYTETEELPDFILKQVGLRYAETTRLMVMNDTERRTFKTIAKYIEKEL